MLTELVENLYMEALLKMKPLNYSMIGLTYCQWLTEAKTLMARNSLLGAAVRGGCAACPLSFLLCSVCCRTTQPAPHLDNVHVVFGQVVGGAALVKQLEALPVDRNARPLQDVTVANCGQLVRLKAGKKRKTDKEKEAEDSDADSEKSHKKEKKKKKDKKEKKKKRHQSGQSEEEEEGEIPSHPLVTTSKIDPKEIPEVPTNRFLMRGGRDQDRDRPDPRRDRERMRYRERERHTYTRSGRIIKGRGVFRYRTPSRSRSRSRSRSVTPPHWRQAQRRIVKLADIERVEQERSEKLHQAEMRQKRAEKYNTGDQEPGTPEQPREKEEGECDTTIERSTHEKIDYNALDFEEDVEHDEEADTSYKRRPFDKSDMRRRDNRDVRDTRDFRNVRDNRDTRDVPIKNPESRADMLALALGVNPKHDKEMDRPSFSGRDFRDNRDMRRREVSSIVQAAPKLSSAVAHVAEAPSKLPEIKTSNEYDPFSLLRSTFNKNKPKEGKDERERVDSRREKDKPKEKEREDKKEKERYRNERDERQGVKSDKYDKERKVSEKSDRFERERKFSEISDKDEVRRDKDDNRKHPEKTDRNRKYSEKSDKNGKSDRKDDERERSRERERYRDNSEKRRDEREKDKKKRRSSRSSSRDRSRTPKRDSKRSPSRDKRDKSRDRSPKDNDKKKQGGDKSTRASKAQGSLIDVVFTKEEERNEARKELMEIVRLIKSRQRDRENKAAESKKKRSPSASSSDSEHGRRRRRSSDRKKSESPRPRRGSSERRRRRRHSSSDR